MLTPGKRSASAAIENGLASSCSVAACGQWSCEAEITRDPEATFSRVVHSKGK
jgi:hypothetical protein